jgi:hypothetical protein
MEDERQHKVGGGGGSGGEGEMEKATTTTFEGMKAPLDDQGFVRSFAVEDVEGQRAFFDTYGFVVVRDVLDHAEVEVRTSPPSPLPHARLSLD